MSANLENPAVATGLEKVNFHSNFKERQCQRILKVKIEVAQSCLTLSDPMDCSPPGSSVHGIFQTRVLEWVAIAFSRKTAAAAAKSLQLCPTLCDPIESSPPGSPIPGILQARTLEWVAISFSNA